VRTCVHRGECSYVYEYLCLYCVSKKKVTELDNLHVQRIDPADFIYIVIRDKYIINIEVFK
jgi:hypothetical protein